MSTADKIRKLLHLSNAIIAARVGCSESYARSVRQRTGPDGHPQPARADRNWIANNREYFDAMNRARVNRWHARKRQEAAAAR